MPDLLSPLFDLTAFVLDRTGAARVLASSSLFPAALTLDARIAWTLAFAGAAVLFLYAALAAGPDRAVRAFRAAMLLLGCTLPILAARLVPEGAARPFGGGVLVVLLFAGFVHRALAARRQEGFAAREIERVRWALEVAGLVLAAVAGFFFATKSRYSEATAFSALFLLRLSIADLLDPSRLMRETGLAESVAKDIKAARRGRRRLRRAVLGALKLLLIVLWIGFPLLAALAPGEVARGEWPRPVIFLAFYPLAALLVTGILLLRGAVRRLRREPFEAARGAVVGLATLLWLWLCLDAPSFHVTMSVLPSLYAVETLAGFLFGTASRRELKPRAGTRRQR
ncbi:MAG: hypothetical protein ACHQJD_01420 [Thermoanaerobaculia bacterium]